MTVRLRELDEQSSFGFYIFKKWRIDNNDS